MANNRVNVSLAFTADTKQAKKQIDDLQNTLSKLATFDHFEVGDVITEKLLKASNTVTKLQSQLKQAFNQDTGRIDLSKFKQQLDISGMSIEKYRDALIDFGPEGERAFLGVARAIQNAEIPLKRSGKLANELWTTLKNTARWQISASIIQGFQGALQKAYGYAQDLNESLNNIRIVTNYSVDDMAKFAVEANKAAKALSTTTTEYTNASLIYYQQGLSAEEVKERTDVTVKMANVSRESAETVSDQMTAVWNNFADGSRTLEYYADVMTALGAATASSTAEMTTGLEKFAAVAETVGLSYEYATTALATITDTTRQSADVVGNALKTLFARIQGLSLGETLEDGTDLTKYSEALAKVGIAIKEQDGSLKDMDTILDEMANKWGALAKDQQVALAQTVAGVRQYTQLVALMDNWDKFQKNLSVANNASGSLQKQADIYAESWEASRERVQAALEAIFNDLVSDEFFIDLNNALAKTIGLLDQMIDNFGGLEGVIAGVGVVLTKVFNKQITQSISNFGFNLKQRWTQGSEEEELKAKTATAMSDWYRKNAENEKSAAWGISETTITNYKRISELQIQLNKDAATQSEKQREINNQFIERLQTMNDLVLASERAAKVAEVQSGAAFNTLNELQYKDNVSKPKTKKKAREAKKAFTDNNTLLGALQQFKDISTQADVSQQSVDDLKKHIESTFNMTIDEATLDDTITKVTKKIKEARKTMLDLYNVTNETLDETGNAFKEKGSSRVVAVNSASNADHTVKETPLPEPDAIEEWSQGLTDLMSGISEVAFGLQSLSTITDTLNNQDLTWGEKTLSILQSVAFGLPSLINGLGQITDGLTSLGSGLSKLGPAIAAGKISWLSYKTTTDAAGVSSKKLMISILGLKMSMGTFLLVIGAVAIAIGGIVAAWNAWKARQPEALLEKAKEESEGLKKALTEAKAASEDLKTSIEGYDSAVKKLKDCVAGTEEWRDALQDANSKALELLEKYPELYKMNAVGKDGDLITIDDKALEKVQQQYKNREYALQGAQVISQQNVNAYDAQVKRDDIEGKAIAAGFSNLNLLEQAANENWDQQKLTEELSKLSSTTLGEGWMNNEITEDTFAQFDYDVAYDLVNEIKELNTEIAANSEATKFAGEAYAETVLADNKKVQNSDSKDYIEKIIGSEVAGIQEKVKQDLGLTSDQAIFNKYKEEYGLDSDAKLNSNGQVMLNGQEITNVAAMTAALTAEEMNAEIDARAAELAKTFASGDPVEIGKAIYNATGDLGDLSHAQIEALDGNESIPQALQDSITQYLTDTSIIDPGLKNLSINLAAGLSELFDGDTSAISSIFNRLGDNADEVANIINQIDWSNWDADDNFAAALEEAGLAGKITAEDFELLTNSLRDSNNATKSFKLEAFREEYAATASVLDKLKETGDTISAKEFETLGAEYEEYFGLMEDGSYALIGDAKEFYDLVKANSVNDLKESLQARQSQMNDYESAGMTADINIDSLQRNELVQMSNALGLESHNISAKEMRENLKAAQEEYKALIALQDEEGAALLATAKNEEEIIALTKEFNISTNVSEKALKTFAIRLSKAQKELKGIASGLDKAAPELKDVMEILSEDPTDEIALTESITAAIKAFPELSGSIMSAYNAFRAATPGTQEYTLALQNLYNIISTNAGLKILEDNGKIASEAVKILENSKSTATEIENAVNNLNLIFGSELFTAEDIGTEKLNLLKQALNGSEEAFKQLQLKMAEGIFTEYGVQYKAIDYETFKTTGIQCIDLADDVKQALIDCGAFDLVEKTVRVPDPSSYVPVEDIMSQEQLEREGLDENYGDGGRLQFGRSGKQVATRTKTMKITLIKPKDASSAADSFSGGGYSGGGGSGKSTYTPKTAPKKDYDYEDRQTEDLQKKLEKETEKRERAIGKAKQQAYEDEEKALDNLYSHYATFKQQLESDLEGIKNDLTSSYGAVFDKNGLLTNYNQVMEAMYAEYNKRMAAAHGNDEATQQVELWWEEVSKLIEKYDEVNDRIIECSDNMEDIDLTKLSNQLEKIQDQVDDVALVADNAMKYLDYQLSQLENKEYAFAEKLVALGGKVNPIAANATASLSALNILLANGIDSAEELDAAKAYADNLYSSLGDMDTLWEDIGNTGVEAISYMNEELDSQMDRLNTLISILGHAKDIAGLLGETFLEDEDATQAEIDATIVEVNQDKLASTKADLEFQRKTAEEAHKQMGQFAEGSKEYEYWKKIAEDADKAVEQHEEQLVSDLKTTLESIDTEFENSVQRVIKTAEEGVTAFESIAEAQKELDWIEQGKDLFLEPFEKAHELSKLTRSINGSMNDLTSSTAKKNLAGLLDMIKEHEESGKEMSEYDLQILQKKYELELARADLEASKNAKSQVRLTRDDEGNWSYQYTADQEKIDEATQNFEDKMFEIEKLSRDHIDETTGTILDLEAQMFEELAGLRREDYASQEEYDAAKKAIEDKYLPRINSLYEQVGGAIENINGLYATEVLTFGESTTGVITGASSQEGAMNQLKVAVETASGQMSLAWGNAFEKMKGALTTAGAKFDGDSKIISDTYLKRIGDKSDEVAGKFQGLMDKFTKDLPSILTGVSTSFTTLGGYFDTLKTKIEAALTAFNLAATTFTGVDLNNTDTWTVEDPEVKDDDVIPEVPQPGPTNTTDNTSMETEAKSIANNATDLLERVHTANLGGYKADGSAGGWKAYARAAGYSEEVIGLVSKALNDSKAGGGYSYFYNKAKELLGLASGGYTGEWGPEGRLALLHQKELVLNAQDTENFLAGINILREITKAIDLQATAMSSPSAFNMPFATSGNGTLEQNVHISASFPGVQDRNEIEFALRNLVNDASQFIMMR